MLSFDSSLSNALKLGNTTAFWALKLYYNAEGSSDFIGVSDSHRIDGSDTYHALVSSWGNYSQSLDFFNFTTTTGNMSVRLINAGGSFQGGRFSDQLATNNFANRKWELFLNTNAAGTYDTAARMIGTGIISGDINYSVTSVSFTLLDMSSRYWEHSIPRATVNSTDHPNAPDKNYAMPIPIAYGDFHEKTGIGTIPTTNFYRFPNFYKGAFPAIVTDEWNATNARIEAACDILSSNYLDSNNVYGHFKNSYAECDTGTADANSSTITATGNDWRLYVPLQSHATYAAGGGSEWSDYADTINGVFNGDYVSFSAGAGLVTVIGWRIPKVEKLGTLTSVHLLMSFASGSGNPNVGFTVKAVGTSGGAIVQTIVASSGAMSGANGEQIETITGLYGGTSAAEWDLEDEIFLVLDDSLGGGSQSIRIYEVGIMIEFKPENGFERSIPQTQEFIETRTVDVAYSKSEGAGTIISSKRKVTSSIDMMVPSITSYLYHSGQGREYGKWIDNNTDASTARTNGLNVGALIESPIYIIEDILRTECGTITKGTADTNTSSKLVDSGTTFPTDVVGQCAYNLTDGTSQFITARDDANTLSLGSDAFPDGNEDYYICGLTDDEIDTTSFDTAGNTASSAGKVYNALGGLASTSEWAFAQDKFTSAKDLIMRISRQCGAYVFISGGGKFKIRTLQQSGYSEDKIVDFNDIILKDIRLTALNSVRNDFTINYNKDYAEGQYQKTATDSDATSQGTGATGYNQVLELEIDADVIGSTTAGQIASMYKAFFKDRHPTISFKCVRPFYNDLEVSDIIKFSNWDASIEIFGAAMGTDYYMVTNISKSVNGCSCKAIKVS